MTKLYRIEELCTDGWSLVDSEAQKLTREQCDLMLNNYLSLGKNPKYLRAVPDND
jgi:hypothetical protein